MTKENQACKGKNKPPGNDAHPPELPHERDEKSNQNDIKPKREMKRAAADIKKGLVDTDLHGIPGVTEAVRKSSKPSRDSSKK